MATTAARLLLLRHPETDLNRQGRWQGHADPGLNARGREQLGELSAELAGEPWDALYASDLLRARQTAEALGNRLGLEPRILPGLRERRMGDWEGLTPEEARSEGPDAYDKIELDPLRQRPPGGESFADLLERVVPVLARIARLHSGRTVVVVTHGGILKGILCALLERDLSERDRLGVGNATSWLFEVDGCRWTLLKPETLAACQTRYDLDGETLR